MHARGLATSLWLPCLHQVNLFIYLLHARPALLNFWLHMFAGCLWLSVKFILSLIADSNLGGIPRGMWCLWCVKSCMERR